MADIKMQRNGTRVQVVANTTKGAVWIAENILQPQTVHYTIPWDVAKEAEEDMQNAGLSVERRT